MTVIIVINYYNISKLTPINSLNDSDEIKSYYFSYVDFLIFKLIFQFLLCPIFILILWRVARNKNVTVIVNIIMILVIFSKLFVMTDLLFNLDKYLTNNFIHELNICCLREVVVIFLLFVLITHIDVGNVIPVRPV